MIPSVRVRATEQQYFDDVNLSIRLTEWEKRRQVRIREMSRVHYRGFAKETDAGRGAHANEKVHFYAKVSYCGSNAKRSIHMRRLVREWATPFDVSMHGRASLLRRDDEKKWVLTSVRGVRYVIFSSMERARQTAGQRYNLQ